MNLKSKRKKLTISLTDIIKQIWPPNYLVFKVCIIWSRNLVLRLRDLVIEEANKRTFTNPPASQPVQVKKEKNDLDEFSNEELLLTLLDRNACFTCICGMMFKDLEMLCLHKRIHDPLDATYCSYCSQRFKTWKEFLEHIKDHSK